MNSLISTQVTAAGPLLKLAYDSFPEPYTANDPVIRIYFPRTLSPQLAIA